MSLTPRETEVLRLVADGLTDNEIGRQLWISPNTVNCHLKWVYKKLNARNRANAVYLGLRQQVIS